MVPCPTELRDEGVVTEIGGGSSDLARGLDRIFDGEIRRLGLSRHIGIAQDVDGDAQCFVEAASAEVSGIDDSRPRGINLGDEGVELPAECLLPGVHGGKVRGAASAR